MTKHRRTSIVLVAGILGLAALLLPRPASAIPVFARVYGKPCSACHTTYPQLNPVGEDFRLHGLHGLTPQIEPFRLGRWFELPGTLPLAISLGVGGDFGKVSRPGTPGEFQRHWNLEYLSVLIGGELGPHLSFLGDYAPLYHDTRTGALEVNTLIGMGFMQAHADAAGWLFNWKGGLFELPFSVSPRVHRLSVQPYFTYGLTAFSLVGKGPPNNGARKDTFNLASTQLGSELSAFQSSTRTSLQLGMSCGSNNRLDNNSSKDVYVHVGQMFGFHRAGVLAYYSPDVLGKGSVDSALRVGPDIALYFRRAMILGQFLAAHDSSPTANNEDLWWYSGFLEADYRLTSRLVALLRPEVVRTAAFDDTDVGGSTHIRRRILQITGGLQFLVLENVKLLTEATYGENNEGVSGKTTESYAITVRLQTAFWPLTPPGLERFSPFAIVPPSSEGNRGDASGGLH